ncbi:MAG: hypothetical protein DRP57_12215 [Spirochaetes bacterium]|nr:MAG: hypothetical protein DRP57_12215 [Spirochaetota bacterium]
MKKKIENIAVGDIVKSYSLEEKKAVFSKITKTYQHLTKDYYLINNQIKVTGIHPFYVDGEWKKVRDLKVGMNLFDGKNEIAIISIRHIKLNHSVNVYDLRVDEYHNYFAQGILVHNKDPPGKSYGIYVETGSGGKQYAGYFGGNVGIGTTTPSEKLHVVGNVKIEGDFEVDNSNWEMYYDDINHRVVIRVK